MAANWLAKGFEVSVWNRTRSKAEPLAAKGAKVAATPREAAQGADFIFAMVADDDASRSVWLGPDGALAGAKSGAIGVESSTLTPDWIRELAASGQGQGRRLSRCARSAAAVPRRRRRTEVLRRRRSANLRGRAPRACRGGQQDGSARARRRGRDLEAHQQPARRRSDRRARRSARGRQKGRLQERADLRAHPGRRPGEPDRQAQAAAHAR